MSEGKHLPPRVERFNEYSDHPAGWYPSPANAGFETYWDGSAWQPWTIRPVHQPYTPEPYVTVNERAVQGDFAKAARQSRDRAQYVRQQKGHSLILNLLLIGPLTLWITTIYYSVSPNHFWHA